MNRTRTRCHLVKFVCFLQDLLCHVHGMQNKIVENNTRLNEKGYVVGFCAFYPWKLKIMFEEISE